MDFNGINFVTELTYSKNEMRDNFHSFLEEQGIHVQPDDIKIDKGNFIKYGEKLARRIIGVRFDEKVLQLTDGEITVDMDLNEGGKNVRYTQELYDQNSPLPFFEKVRGREEWKFLGLYLLTEIDKKKGALKFEKQFKTNEEPSEPAESPALEKDLVVRDCGAGFGHSENNKEVEKAAIGFVTRQYEEEGWTVRSRENDKCGYDLECTKGDEVEHVEVKGVKGTEPSFFITRNEVDRANDDDCFFVEIITNALREPDSLKLSGNEFRARFELSPVIYKAIQKGNQA